MKTFLTAYFILWLYPVVNAQTSLDEAGLKGNVRSMTLISYDDMEGKPEFSYMWDYEYDKYGNQVRRANTYTNTNSQTVSVWGYRYDNEGNKIEETENNWRTYFTYDKSRRLVEAKRYGSDDGELLQRTVFTYDSNGNCIDELDYKGDGAFISNTVRKFDEANRLICKTIDSTIIDMMKGDKDCYKYDEKGIMTENLIYRPGTNGTTMVKYFDTKLDDHGNWIRRTEMIIRDKQTFKVICERKIAYYQ